MRHLLIEGWRRVNHSLALVNQNQILALRRRPGLRLSHRDLPYFHPHWSPASHASGFDAEHQARVDGLGLPGGQARGEAGRGLETGQGSVQGAGLAASIRVDGGSGPLGGPEGEPVRERPGESGNARPASMQTPAGNGAEPHAASDRALGNTLGSTLENTASAPIDVIYRIAAPLREPEGDTPTISFIVTEFGLSDANCASGRLRAAHYTAGPHHVATPSHWSRERLLEAGFAAERVHVLPHGVDSHTFRPLSEAERSDCRLGMGLRPEHFVFLNVGTAMWNKGHDLLLDAFARVHQRHPRARLLLKDLPLLHGIGLRTVLDEAIARQPTLFNADTLQAISLIPANLALADLRHLYGTADAYVSPYRAEGFNLPVLEALACGLPVIATAGGATDDYTRAGLCTPVDSDARSRQDIGTLAPARFREPRLDSLIDAMHSHLERPRRDELAFHTERAVLMNRLSWDRVVDPLLALVEAAAAPAR